jgi:membrane fusion protein (multidrug efflux system)
MNSPAPAADASAEGMSNRRRGLLILAATVVVGVCVWAVYWYVHGRWFVSTEDAYVGGTIVQITAEIPGTIRAIHPRETESVTAGQTLIELDPSDAKVAWETALADLGSTVRQVRGSFVQVDRARAQLAAHAAELRRARADYERRQSIASGGAVSTEEVAHARESTDALEASVRAAQEELNMALTQTQGTSVERHPLVERAAARVRDAALALSRTTITSPVDGVVGKKGVQLGQRVAPGTPLLAVVPLSDVWVDANYKEVQLRRMRIGQPVELRADLYGGDVNYHGRIRGFSPGTGAAFALLPAQNASGNWIKVVQRVPVRITLDPNELQEHPLRIGLSMRVEVDLHDQSGPVLAAPTTDIAASMQHHAELDPQVEATIARIIAGNSGNAVTR